MKELKMYIGGQWTDAASGRTFETVNPATGEVLGRVPLAGDADVDAAVKAARAAFPAWSKLPQSDRSAVCLRIARVLRENARELALLESAEHGTPFGDSFGVTMGAAAKFENSAAIAQNLMGVQVPIDSTKLSYFKREPMGVCALIIPWNLPVIMMAVKMSACIAVGNTCVMKPPSINSLTGLKFAEIISKADIPDGVVNIITGPGDSVGKALASHRDVDLIGFTGSSETGKAVLGYASSTVKKGVMELGGNNPVIVMEDADLDECVKILGHRQFNNCGQHCSGPGRYYVHEKVYDAFLEKFAAFASGVKVGDPMAEDTFMGPVVSRSHQAKVEGYIDSAVSEGARIYFTQEKTDYHKGGSFVMPTVICDASHDMKIAREEVFGPVAVVIKYTDADDIVSLANDSEYGLCAHIWTNDIKRGLRMVDDLRVGSVFINTQTLTDEQSWGTSCKESGLGKEGGILGMQEFTDMKMVTIDFSVG